MTGACGTTIGYHRHQRDRTIACRPCLKALAVAARVRNIKAGKVKTLSVPIGLVAVLLQGGQAHLVRRVLGAEICAAISSRFLTTSSEGSA